MAKKSAVETNKRRERLAERFRSRRLELKIQLRDESLSPEDRFKAQMKLSELPRNSSRTRVRNRCLLSGRPRGTYRKFKLSRIALRDLASNGKIPGMTKASW
ncbi:MAG: 30S ribosomal protein S14 [Pseudomonadota bacterium]